MFIKLHKKLLLEKELFLNLNQLDLYETLPYHSLWENPNMFQKWWHFNSTVTPLKEQMKKNFQNK